jgi:hypothetical protein
MAVGPALIALQVASAVAGGLSENAQARGEARQLDENARLTQLNGESDVLAALRQSRMEEGAGAADAAASGQQGIGSGNIADMIYANAIERQREAMTIRANAQSEASGLRAQASAARSRGKAAIIGGVFRAGAAALSGIQSQNDMARIDAATQAGRAADLRQPQRIGSIPIPRNGLVAEAPRYDRMGRPVTRDAPSPFPRSGAGGF